MRIFQINLFFGYFSKVENLKYRLLHIAIILLSSLSIYAQTNPCITRWDLSVLGSGTTQLSFGVVTSGVVSYTWETVPSGTSGSGTFNGTIATITDLPSGAVIDLKIVPTNFQRINIGNGIDKSRLIEVKQWGDIKWISMANAFWGCNNLNITATDTPNLTFTTSMYQAFANCINLNGPSNINSWNVGTITDMSYMFAGTTVFNQNIGSWNVSAVTNMSNMFYRARAFNQNIGLWNVSAVRNMNAMFDGATVFNQNIGSWNVSAVRDMAGMFYQASTFNQNIGSWNVSSVIDMGGMFNEAASFNQNIGTWNVSSVIDMRAMFGNAIAFNQDISLWDVSSVRNMFGMFSGAIVFNQNISSWNVSLVTNMCYLFLGARVFNQNISSWNISSVTNMSNMFNQANAFNQNLGAWGRRFNASVDLSSMLDNCGMSLNNYDATLIGFNSGVITGRNLGASGLQYCASLTQRTNLINTKGWTISGDSYTSSCPAPVPEINLKGNNVSITNGNTSPSTTNYTDFGSINISLGTVVRTFTIENLGIGTLNLTGIPNRVVISGTNASDFSVTIQPASTLLALSTTTFEITFDPSTLGTKIATISIVNNDSDENPYTFSVQGVGNCNSLNLTSNITWESIVITAQAIIATNRIANSNVEYRATQSITLQPGFQATRNLFKTNIGNVCN